MTIRLRWALPAAWALLLWVCAALAGEPPSVESLRPWLAKVAPADLIPGSDRFGAIRESPVVASVYRDARLVGMSWYVRTENGQPPAGFVGGNDWWHHHPRLCFNRTTAVITGVNQTDSACQANNGMNLHTQDYYMVHLWVVDGLPYEGDVFAPTHPCIKSTGAIFDEDDPCHTSLLGGAGGAAPLAGKADEQSYGYCPIGSLAAS